VFSDYTWPVFFSVWSELIFYDLTRYKRRRMILQR